jgi:hypothetical protein
MVQHCTRAILAASLTAFLALAAPAAASHQYRDTARCASKTVRNVQVLVSTSEAVAFRKRFPTRPYATYASYACMRRGAGSIERLKRSEFSLSRVRPQLAGRYVAFRRLDELNEFSSASGIVVQDLRTGTIAYESPRDGSYMTDWVVKRNGSAAWIDFPPEDQSGIRVWKVDSTTGGQRQPLDSGEPVIGADFQSLRLSADRRQVLWTKNGAQQSAPID